MPTFFIHEHCCFVQADFAQPVVLLLVSAFFVFVDLGVELFYLHLLFLELVSKILDYGLFFGQLCIPLKK